MENLLFLGVPVLKHIREVRFQRTFHSSIFLCFCFQGLKDTGIIKRHLKAIKEMVYSKSYVPKSPTEDIAEQMLRNLVKAIL